MTTAELPDGWEYVKPLFVWDDEPTLVRTINHSASTTVDDTLMSVSRNETLDEEGMDNDCTD